MTTTYSSVDRPAVFDPFEPGFVESPYDQYRRLRTHDPVHWSNLLDGWVVTRWADVWDVLRNPTVSVDLDNATATPVVELQRERQRRTGRSSETVVLRDDPDHQRLRRLLQRPFGPRPVAALRALVVDRVEQTLEPLGGQGTMDVIADFAYPLPVGVFCEMLGLPDEDAEQVRGWIRSVARLLDPVIDEDEHDRCVALMNEMYDYLDHQLAQREQAPRDDVLTELVQAGQDPATRDLDQGWHSRTELVAQIVTLYVAGHEPTTALIGNGLLALLRHPDQLALLKDRPELLPDAVHELLRFDGPNQFVRRIATAPLTVGDRDVAPGDVLYLCLAAANRDPDRWDNPDELRVERPDVGRHLQLGAGAHACLGTHLARLQAEVALGALLAGIEGVELDGDPVWSDRMVLRGLQALPIRFSPSSVVP